MEFFKKLRKYGIRKIFLFLIPEIKRFYRLTFLGSYSHLGEDLFLSKNFPKDYKGFYVDVGANDPISKSNTYYFYKKGWRGINIEPDLACYNKLMKVRTEDINLNIGIGEVGGRVDYYSLFPSSLNTFSKKDADRSVSEGYELLEVSKMDIRRLDEVLDEYLPANTKIDFISIDTEGYDLNVLKSMNIERFKPKFICFECAGNVFLEDIDILLKENNYLKIFSNGSNTIYKYSGE